MSDSHPPHGGSEILESGGGEPTASPRRGRRTALIAGGVLGGVAVVGGAAWAATWYLASGPAAAEVLPDTTLAYVSINLDPSGEQLLAARETLEKFPAWTDEDISSQGDVRKWLFDQAQEESACDGLDYEEDVYSWLGDRAAIAAVDLGEDTPTPVGVVEVTDTEAAESAFAEFRACAAEDSQESESGEETEETGGWAFRGDWAVFAETTEIAEDVVAASEEGTLADDETHQAMLDEAGDPGVMTMYAAPAAATTMLDLADEAAEGEIDSETLTDLRAIYEDFGGAAGHVRFADGSVEVEYAGESAAELTEAFATEAGDDVVASLPADTALAIGYGFKAGWLDTLVDQFGSATGMSTEELYEEFETETGLALPEDVETLLGESAAVAVGGEADVEAMVNSGDFSSVQFAAKVKGDGAAIEEVVEKLRTLIGPDADQLVTRTDGEFVTMGLDQEAVDVFAEGGDLGDQGDYQDVVAESERAAFVVYLNADAGDDWLVKALESADAGEEIVENARPLSGLGMSAWVDGDVQHGLFRLTTD